MVDKIEIKAAMEDDMFAMLDKWGELKKLDAGELRCPCGITITRDNLAAIKPVRENIIYLHSLACNYDIE